MAHAADDLPLVFQRLFWKGTVSEIRDYHFTRIITARLTHEPQQYLVLGITLALGLPGTCDGAPGHLRPLHRPQ